MVFFGQIVPETIRRDHDHIRLLLLRRVIGPAGCNNLDSIGWSLGSAGQIQQPNGENNKYSAHRRNLAGR